MTLALYGPIGTQEVIVLVGFLVFVFLVVLVARFAWRIGRKTR